MSLAADITALAPTARLELFVLDATSIGGDVFRFHAGTNQLNQPVKWQGESYLRLPVEIEGIEAATSGALARPTMTLANFTIDQAGNKVYGYLSAVCMQYRDLQGAKVINKATLAKYLDAANFPNGNPSANPNAHFPDEIWYVDRKAEETDEYIKFELASTLDLTNVNLPSRPLIANICPADYKDPEFGCSWSPNPDTGPWFDALGNSVDTAEQDKCSKRRTTGCAVRFGPTAGLPFMGFPGLSLIQQ